MVRHASVFFYLQGNMGKKRSELKHLIKERAKKLDEIKQSIKVIKVSLIKTTKIIGYNISIGH